MLLEGDPECENVLRGMMVVDNLNPTYAMDFTKFIATISGGGGAHAGPAGIGAITTGGATGYY